MLARLRIQAGVDEHQAPDRLASDDMRLNDFVDVGLRDMSIPNCVGIDDEVRAMFALIETARLVGAYFALEAAFRQFLFE